VNSLSKESLQLALILQRSVLQSEARAAEQRAQRLQQLAAKQVQMRISEAIAATCGTGHTFTDTFTETAPDADAGAGSDKKEEAAAVAKTTDEHGGRAAGAAGRRAPTRKKGRKPRKRVRMPPPLPLLLTLMLGLDVLSSVLPRACSDVVVYVVLQAPSADGKSAGEKAAEEVLQRAKGTPPLPEEEDSTPDTEPVADVNGGATKVNESAAKLLLSDLKERAASATTAAASGGAVKSPHRRLATPPPLEDAAAEAEEMERAELIAARDALGGAADARSPDAKGEASSSSSSSSIVSTRAQDMIAAPDGASFHNMHHRKHRQPMVYYGIE